MQLISEAKELIAKKEAKIKEILENKQNYENFMTSLSKKYNPELISEYRLTFMNLYNELPTYYIKLSSWDRIDYIWRNFPNKENADFENAKKKLLSHMSRDEVIKLNVLQEKLYNLV